jgi:hypothetical protein
MLINWHGTSLGCNRRQRWTVVGWKAITISIYDILISIDEEVSILAGRRYLVMSITFLMRDILFIIRIMVYIILMRDRFVNGIIFYGNLYHWIWISLLVE